MFCSADLGYWVSQEYNGRGVATAAVAAVVRRAFDELGLHRVQAGTLVHNLGSQQVLLRNDFTRIGLAPAYLRIAGRWQDHLALPADQRERRLIRSSRARVGPVTGPEVPVRILSPQMFHRALYRSKAAALLIL